MAIFIVDDSDVVRNVVKQTLSMYGFNDILEASNGKEAFEKIQSAHSNVELYIFDVNMPEMDGITLVGKTRGVDSETPIIMLTTETDKAKMVKAKELGATGWVIKPFEGEKFMKVVNMLLKQA